MFGMEDPVTNELLEEGGYTVLGICRDLLTKVEAQYTESDFRLLSDDEVTEVMEKVGYDYGREIGREIGSD